MSSFKLVQVVGARPQIIKSAALSRVIAENYAEQLELITLHTGQHYDQQMSQIFYQELGISEPDILLSTRAESHAQQTGSMMRKCEAEFKQLKPDAVLVYGDTNSTLAAALAASKLGITVFHVEAGLRSHNLAMPEECNRIATDHLSSLLFCPSPAAISELAKEGLQKHEGQPSIHKPGIYLSGDIMYDNSLYYSSLARDTTQITGLEDIKGSIMLATCHRPVNTDQADVLEQILKTLAELATAECPVVLPMHPRLNKHQALIDLYRATDNLYLIEAVSYLEMLGLLDSARLVITDSGGLQKEAYFKKRPCIVLREQTEWTELIDTGKAILCGQTPERIRSAAAELLKSDTQYPELYGQGQATEQICQHIIKFALRA